MGGKGGGKPESAQASGTNPACLDEAMDKCSKYALSKMYSSGGGDSSCTPCDGPIFTYVPSNIRSLVPLIALQYSKKKVNTKEGDEVLYRCGEVKLKNALSIASLLSTDQLTGSKSNLYESQIVQWVSFAESELFPLICQWVYPNLQIGSVPKDKSVQSKVVSVLESLNKVLEPKTYLVGECVTLADIGVFAALIPAFKYAVEEQRRKSLINLMRWFDTIANQPQVRAVVGKIEFCKTEIILCGKPAQKENKTEKKESKKTKKEEKEDVEEMDEAEKAIASEPSTTNPFSSLPKSSFDLDDFKRFYSNESEEKSIPYLWEKIDLSGWSLWFCEYKYPEELKQTFMSCNLITGMFQRLDKMRKHSFASVCLFGESNNSSISGVWLWRGQDLIFPLCPDWQVDFESYSWTKLDPSLDKTKRLVQQYLSWTGSDAQNRKFNQGKIFK